MREPLDGLLCSRYPDLYADRRASPRVTSLCWGFPEDGWFGIIDALSADLVRDAAERGVPVKAARQVKEKFGTLRFYCGTSDRGFGAIRMAEDMSARICEVSGRPGRLFNQRGWWRTLTPDLATGERPKPDASGVERSDDGQVGIPALGFTADDVRQWRADVLSLGGVLDIPIGWLDLADAALLALASKSDEAPPVHVSSIRRVDEVMRIDFVGGAEHAEGIARMASALSRRIDPTTGAMGPVGDAGHQADT